MEQLTPFSYGAHQVRTILIDGEPWFVATDVCDVLGYSRARNALRMLRDRDRGAHSMSTPGGLQEVVIISEPGLYRLVMRSDRPDAERFQDWVTDEVLPSIRKTGGYGVATFDPRNLDHVAQLAATAAEQARQIEAARPAVEFVDKFVSGAGTYLLREVAAVLNVKGMGQNNLFAFLRDHGVLIKDGDSRNLPYRRHIEAGRFEVKVGQRDNSRTGEPVAVRTVRVTPRGLDYIRGLLESNGYRCMGDVA